MMAAKRTDDLGAIVRIADHPRTRCQWVLTVTAGKIDRIARIAVQYPPPGHADRPLRVAVTDWGNLGPDHSPAQFVGIAGGYGYDKLTAALAGATVGGIELGDHCSGRPTLRELCNPQGWEVIEG